MMILKGVMSDLPDDKKFYTIEDSWSPVYVQCNVSDHSYVHGIHSCEPVKIEGRRILRLVYGNAMGIFRIPGFDYTINVRSKKIDKDGFNVLMDELASICTALPFSGSGSSSFGIERIDQGRYLSYHALIYLYYALVGIHPNKATNLTSALQNILREPHRRFEKIRVKKHLSRVSEVDDKTLLSIAEGSRTTVKVNLPTLPPILRDRIPEYLDIPRKKITVNTPENRFVKFFLDEAIHLVRSYEEILHKDGRRSRYLKDMKEQLTNFRRHGLWEDVERLTHLPVGSTVLQQHRAYREVFKVFIFLHRISRFNQILDPATGLLEVHDIGKLYEIWCFFKMFEVLQSILCNTAGFESKITEGEHGMSVVWDGRNVNVGHSWTLSYQRSFTQNNGSTSLPFIPDIALFQRRSDQPGGEILHLFDAKFRVDHIPESQSDDKDSKLKDDEVRIDFNRDALYKMHTYHDALPSARTVWAIYPGTKFKFFPAGITRGGDGNKSIGCVQDFQQKYSEGRKLGGVGAIPLKPEAVSSRTSPFSDSKYTLNFKQILQLLTSKLE